MVNGRQDWIFLGKFTVEIQGVSSAFLFESNDENSSSPSITNTIRNFRLLTILGRKGGLTFLASKASQSISLKNGWTLMAASAPWLVTQPNRLDGFFVINYWIEKS